MKIMLGISILSCALLLPLYANAAGRQTVNQSSKPSLVVRSISIRSDQVKKSSVPIEVQLLNTDKRAITAFYISLVVKYKDGTQKTYSQGEDLLLAYATYDSMSQTSRNIHLLRPNEANSKAFSVALGADGTAPTTAEASFPMIIFEDCTAIGSQTLIQCEFESRRKQSEQWAGIVTDLTNAGAQPDPAGALENRSEELIAAGRPASGITDMRARILKELAAALRKNKAPAGEALKGVIALYRRQLEILKQQSTLKGGT